MEERPEYDISQSKPIPQGLWILVALGAHTGWGCSPVVVRYLIKVSGLPTISILALGNLIAFAVLAVFIVPRIPAGDWKKPVLWLFLGVTILRAVTNMWAAEFTLAIYVQMIYLLSPFVVVLISRFVYHEALPRFTLPAIVLSLAGSLLMMQRDWPVAASQGFSAEDWMGISLALISMLFVSLYMVLIRRTVHHRISGEAVLATQLAGLALIPGAISLGLGEDWSAYLNLDQAGTAVFVFYVLAILIGANLGQISSIRRLGASMVSSLIAWRMVAALVFGAMLLEERLTSPVEISGAALIVITITGYLWQQRTPRSTPMLKERYE